MQAKIEIIHVVQVAGTSRKTGNDYDIRNAQCVVRDPDPETGEVQPRIGVLSLPVRYKDLPKGVYRVEFDAAVATNGRIVSEVADIKPWDAAAAGAPVRKVMVEILGVLPRSGFSKKTLKDYSMLFAECIVHKADRDTGLVSLLVGELLVPERFKDIVPGMYAVEFEIAISQDKRIGGRVADMTLQQSAARTAAPASRSPSAAPASAAAVTVPPASVASAGVAAKAGS
ncbi:hypothetical protein RugamoR57_29100 [Duganella caerulea]|uniref:hypothetical protein n=1 Tax=Duganella caerulea TaxID=2885762 RepID=UPI0030EB0DB7